MAPRFYVVVVLFVQQLRSKSRYQQIPRHVFHPLFWCDKSVGGTFFVRLKVDPDRFGSFSSDELLESNVAHQINDN